MSPTTSNDKPEALVFRGANFNLFKVRIQAKLRSKGLWRVVSVAKYVPNLKKNLLSYRLLLKDGFELAKWDLDVAIMIRDTFVLKFTHHRVLYILRPYADQINSCLVRQPTPKLVQWHLHLAHLNFGAIKQAARDGVMEGMHLTKSDLAQDYNCEVCEVAKARRMSYKNTKPYRTQVPLERVHIDKGGPITPPTFGGKMHYEL
ncbi:hypothetical protein As57867_019462, partial [Aphanomyces stellatus]